MLEILSSLFTLGIAIFWITCLVIGLTWVIMWWKGEI